MYIFLFIILLNCSFIFWDSAEYINFVSKSFITFNKLSILVSKLFIFWFIELSSSLFLNLAFCFLLVLLTLLVKQLALYILFLDFDLLSVFTFINFLLSISLVMSSVFPINVLKKVKEFLSFLSDKKYIILSIFLFDDFISESWYFLLFSCLIWFLINIG